MSYEFHKESYNGHVIRIVQEECPESPRSWDTLGTIWWFTDQAYPRNNDRKIEGNSLDAVLSKAEPFLNAASRMSGFEYHQSDLPKDIEEAAINWVHQNYALLYLDVWSRGGRVSSRRTSSTPWDHSGIIFADRKTIESNFSGDDPWETKLERALVCLGAEIITLNQYYDGEVAGYIAETEDGDEIDSCWGFYPDEHGSWSYPISEAKHSIDWHIKHTTELDTQLCMNI